MEEMFLKGRNGNIKVENDIVIITREGFVAMLTTGVLRNGEKRIPINSIISVELGKEPSMLDFSYIRFATAVDKEVTNGYFTRAGALANDPNTVQIKDKDQYGVAKKIKNYIESFQNNIVNKDISSADEIKKI